ncbi:MAG: site-specific integrase [Spirochaetia bacterium]
MSKRNPQRIYVYERKREGKPSLWYARFRGENGKMGSPMCTDQPDRASALQWANDYLIDHRTPAARKPKPKSFEEWSKPWWRFESCPYVKYRQTRGFSISRVYVENRRYYLEHYLIPEFGERLMAELKPWMFRDYSIKLKEEGRLSPASINKILSTMRIMVKHACAMGELDTNPMSAVGDLKETPKRRGILVPDELRRLFGPAAKEHVWQGELRHYAINLLACATGMRMGECRALRLQDINFTDNYVQIDHAWTRYGLTAPKWHSERIVTLPKPVQHAINELLAFKRWGDPQPADFIFWGTSRDIPIPPTSILKAYKRALTRIGIPLAEQESRNLVFHSWRHGFNAYLRGRVPDEQLRRVTGHRSVEMTDDYDHVRAEMLGDILAEQERLLTFETQEALVAGIRAPGEEGNP